MPIFSKPDDYKKHVKYVPLIKKALKLVNADPGKHFYYFKKYPFDPKPMPLLLVDANSDCRDAAIKIAGRVTAKGMVTLTEKDELKFTPKEGKINTIRLQKYFTSMGGGINPVFIPAGEVDEDEEGGAGEGAVTSQAKPTPTVMPELPSIPSTSASAGDKAMDRKMAFEEAAFKLKEKIAALEKAQFPADQQAKKDQALKMAKSLVATGKHADAAKLLDALAVKATTSTSDATKSPVQPSPTGPQKPRVAPVMPDLPPIPSTSPSVVKVEPPKQGSLKVGISRTTPIVLKRALKGEENKKTCLMDIGGRTYVVKGGSGNAGDHLAASDFINKLGLKGVKAPVARTLDAEERSIIAAGMPKDNKDAQELAKSLSILGPDGYATGLVTELCDGRAIDKLMPTRDVRRAQKATTDALNEVKDMGQKEAWKAITTRLNLEDQKEKSEKFIKTKTESLPKLISDAEAEIKKIKNSETAETTEEERSEIELKVKEQEDKITTAKKVIQDANLKLSNLNNALSADTPKARKAAVAWLTETKVSPTDVALTQVLTIIDSGKKIQQVIEESEEEAKAVAADRKILKDFAESAEGIEAFAGVAVSDLLAGMDDRILSKPNGGNFLFDPKKKELQCVDNHKDPNKSLNMADTETEEVKKANLNNWKTFMNGNLTLANASNLEDMIFEKIYGENTALDGLVTFDDEQQKAEAKAKIHEILVGVVAKVAGNKDFGGPASERAAVLKAKLLEDLFKVDPGMATPPAPPDEPGKLDKMGQKAKDLLSSKKRDTTKEVKEIKDGLAKGTLSPELAKQRLTALQQERQSMAADPRSSTIDFMISATEFCKDLEGRSSRLDRLIKAAPDTWSAATAKSLSGPLRSAYVAWTTSAANNEKTLKLLKKAWATFPAEVNSA